jgi:hypothetical protein
LQQDLPQGQAYSGDVRHVAAGYARNYLIPQKMALYATRQNFARLDIKDPEQETAEERKERLARERLASEDQDLKAANILKNYLRNKVVCTRRGELMHCEEMQPSQRLTRLFDNCDAQLKIWRNVDPVTEDMQPGMIDAKAIRKKLSKQLRIDLESHEKVHIRGDPLLSLTDLKDSEAEKLMEELGDPTEPCATQVKQLGEFLARISLAGGFSVPLKVEVLKR